MTQQEMMESINQETEIIKIKNKIKTLSLLFEVYLLSVVPPKKEVLQKISIAISNLIDLLNKPTK